MKKAFLFVARRPHKRSETDIIDQIRILPTVLEVTEIFGGGWDILIKIEGEPEQMRQTRAKISSMDDVRSLTVLMVTRSLGGGI